MTVWETEGTAGLEAFGAPLLLCARPLLPGDMTDPPPLSGDAPPIDTAGLQLSPPPAPMPCAAVFRLYMRGATMLPCMRAASPGPPSELSDSDGMDAEGVW